MALEWACKQWGQYEHDWLNCPECLENYENYNERVEYTMDQIEYRINRLEELVQLTGSLVIQGLGGDLFTKEQIEVVLLRFAALQTELQDGWNGPQDV